MAILRADGTLAGQMVEREDFAQFGGGYVTGCDVADNGTVVTRNDTYNGYVLYLGEARNRPLIRPGYTLATLTETPFQGGGSWEVAVCPTNDLHVAVVSCVRLFMSTSRNAQGDPIFYRANLPTLDTAMPNNNPKQIMTRMAYDPAKPSRLVLGYQDAEGLYLTDDSGVSAMTQIGVGTLPMPRNHLVIGGSTPVLTVLWDVPGTYGANLKVNAPGTASVVLEFSSVGAKYVTVTPAVGASTGSAIAAQLNADPIVGPVVTASGTSGAVAAGTYNAQEGAHSIAFDRSSAVVGGKTQRFVVAVSGWGGWETNNGGTSFTAISNFPLCVKDMQISEINGDVIVIDRWADNIKRLRADAWITGTNSSGMESLALHHSDANKMWAIDSGGVRGSIDQAVSWSASQAKVRNEDVPWLQYANETFMTNGGSRWCRTTSTIVFTWGIGWGRSQPNPPLSGGTITWNGSTKGIRNMIGAFVDVRPDGTVDVAEHDRPTRSWTRNGLAVDPGRHGPGNDVSLRQSMHRGYSTEDPSWQYIAAAKTIYRSQGVNAPWVEMPNQPDWRGGPNAVFNTGMIEAGGVHSCLFLPAEASSGRRRPQWCWQGGPWQVLDFGDSTLNTLMDTVTWQNWYYLNRIVISSDRANNNTFYLHCNTSEVTCKGIWKVVLTAGGAIVTRVTTQLFEEFIGATLPVSLGFYNAHQKMVPGQGRAMFYTSGSVGSTFDAPGTVPLIYTPDIELVAPIGLTAWPREVRCFGFGKAKGNHPYPAILLHSEQNGFYKCENFNPLDPNSTPPEFIGKYLNYHYDVPNGICGDMGLFGRWYVAHGGSGSRAYDWRTALAVVS